MPFGVVMVVIFALAGASVARRRGWPVVLGAIAAGLVPPVGIVAVVLFVADRLRDAVAAQTGGLPEGQAGPTRGPLRGPGGSRPELGGLQRPQPRRPRRETPPPPQPLPDSLEGGTVLRALRTHGPMSEAELLAALVDPPTEVRYQLRELERHAAVLRRHGKYVVR